MGGVEEVRALLDTNVFLWFVSGSRKLRPKTKRLLERADSELWLSPISIWECLILERDRRIRLEPNPLRWARDVLAIHPFREAPLNHEVALQTRGIALPHEDPADRFLAATASVYDLTLVTGDERLLEGTGYSVAPNE